MPGQDDSAQNAPEKAARLRRELERVAFARPGSSEDAAAAQAALRQLIAADESAAGARAAVEPTISGVSERGLSRPESSTMLTTDVQEADDEDGEPGEPAIRKRRSLIPLVIVIGIVVGLGVGLIATRATPNLFPAATLAAQHPNASPNRTSGDATNALAELESPQTPRDVFPNADFARSLHVRGTSVHRILETSGGQTLWVARSPSDICLMISLSDSKSNIDAGASCVSIARFSKDGVTLGDGNSQWSWNGSTFVTN